jgi:hypothetical protein
MRTLLLSSFITKEMPPRVPAHAPAQKTRKQLQKWLPWFNFCGKENFQWDASLETYVYNYAKIWDVIAEEYAALEFASSWHTVRCRESLEQFPPWSGVSSEGWIDQFGNSFTPVLWWADDCPHSECKKAARPSDVDPFGIPIERDYPESKCSCGAMECSCVYQDNSWQAQLERLEFLRDKCGSNVQDQIIQIKNSLDTGQSPPPNITRGQFIQQALETYDEMQAVYKKQAHENQLPLKVLRFWNIMEANWERENKIAPTSGQEMIDCYWALRQSARQAFTSARKRELLGAQQQEHPQLIQGLAESA